jgi:hypothetical protein
MSLYGSIEIDYNRLTGNILAAGHSSGVYDYGYFRAAWHCHTRHCDALDIILLEDCGELINIGGCIIQFWTGDRYASSFKQFGVQVRIGYGGSIGINKQV